MRCTKTNCPMQASAVSDDCYNPDCPWLTETFLVGQLLGWTISGNINTCVYTAEHALGLLYESKDLCGLVNKVVTMSCLAAQPQEDTK